MQPSALLQQASVSRIAFYLGCNGLYGHPYQFLIHIYTYYIIHACARSIPLHHIQGVRVTDILRDTFTPAVHKGTAIFLPQESSSDLLLMLEIRKRKLKGNAHSTFSIYLCNYTQQDMIGTIVNTITIITGSLIGALCKRHIRPQWQKVMFTAMGLASLSLGFNAVCRNMPHSQYPVLFILSLSIGGLIGTMLNLEGRFKGLVDRLQKHGRSNSGDRQSRLAQGLSTGLLLYCIGTLSILGPIKSALLGDNTFLYTNATLDLVTSAVLATTYGAGMALAAPVLFCWQGSIWLLARLCGNIIPPELLTEMSIVGGTLIAASGLSILEIKDCKTLNLLPSLFIPVLFFLGKSLI